MTGGEGGFRKKEPVYCLSKSNSFRLLNKNFSAIPPFILGHREFFTQENFNEAIKF